MPDMDPSKSKEAQAETIKLEYELQEWGIEKKI
jgi:hypothetical protein